MSSISTEATAVGSAIEKPLSNAVTVALERYLKNLDGAEPIDLYKIVLEEFEQPLFQKIMEFNKGNQVQAAHMLGISRGTLRKKLVQYFGTTHVGLPGDAKA